MPIVRIARPKALDPSVGLPLHAQSHVLTLCEQHLSQETWDRFRALPDDFDALPDCGGAVFAWAHKLLDKHIFHTVYSIDFHCADGHDVSDLPKDLLDCVVFAAGLGFTAITFEPHDPIDCPLIERLPIYPRTYDPSPKYDVPRGRDGTMPDRA